MASRSDANCKLGRARRFYGLGVSLMLLAACGTDRTEGGDPVVTTTPISVTATSTAVVPAATTTAAPPSGGLGDAIGVTDRVTIVITEPDDG